MIIEVGIHSFNIQLTKINFRRGWQGNPFKIPILQKKSQTVKSLLIVICDYII